MQTKKSAKSLKIKLQVKVFCTSAPSHSVLTPLPFMFFEAGVTSDTK